MAAIPYPDLADHRAATLEGHGLNGIQLALVALAAGPDPAYADIELRFVNGLHLPAILADIGADPVRAGQLFRVRGGTRIVAGNAAGQVRVASVAGIDATRLRLRVAPVGDYSTYTLDLVWDAHRIDPFFSTIGFRFRPGCFTNDCRPPQDGRPAAPGPAIDYLAKDYDSFRHALMVAMAARVPGWASTSEADLDQVLIDLFAAAADELSDYQDRVASEAWFATARKRVSLARHARLVDYHIHEGNQSSTWLRVEVDAGTAPFTLDTEELVVRAGTVYFASRQNLLDAGRRQWLDPRLNALRLHTWGNSRPALAAGSTGADLVPPAGLATQAEADALRDLVRTGRWREIVIEERLNPLTGTVPGRQRAKRQLLRLLAGSDPARGAAESVLDPVAGTWVLRVNWRDDDALRFDYSFTTFCPGPPPKTVEDVSMFHANLVPVHEGRPLTVLFHEADTILAGDTAAVKQRHYARMDRYGAGRGDWTLAALPDAGPLAYLPPPDGSAPSGEAPARSTLRLRVELPDGVTSDWREVESLVHSTDTDADFMVETDEQQRSVLRFGNGRNGLPLPPGAIVHARYQVGGGHAGNVGADQLTRVEPFAGPLAGVFTAATNPFDVTDGRDPEPPERIRRNAPEAFRSRQLRAVTLADYVHRAAEVDGVSRAVARYAWTGSWRTVRIALDPAGFTALGDARSQALWNELEPRVAEHLEAVRLVGEDLELRPPRYVPLEIHVKVCAGAGYWREDLAYLLEQEFSDGYTADGRRGFFHPDEWTFGQALHRSAIEGRIARVTGIEHVVGIVMRRFSAPQPGVPGAERLEMAFDEVVLLANDPDHLERGLIRFDVQGGRR